MHWRRKWQPTPVFLPGESQGQRSLVGCRLCGLTESDTTEVTQQQQLLLQSLESLPSFWYLFFINGSVCPGSVPPLYLVSQTHSWTGILPWNELYFRVSPMSALDVPLHLTCSPSQLCLTLCDPVDCRPPGSSVHGILQARILEQVAFLPPGDLPDAVDGCRD